MLHYDKILNTALTTLQCNAMCQKGMIINILLILCCCCL